MPSSERSLEPCGIGDCWRVVIEQWNRMSEPVDGIVYGGESLPDAIGYIAAPCATDAAAIAEAAYTTSSGPLTRVKAVEYVGPAWMEALRDD